MVEVVEGERVVDLGCRCLHLTDVHAALFRHRRAAAMTFLLVRRGHLLRRVDGDRLGAAFEENDGRLPGERLVDLVEEEQD